MYSTGLIRHEGKAYSPDGLTDLGKSEKLDCGHDRPEVESGAFTVPWGIVQTSDGPAEYCLDCVAALEVEALRVLPKGAGYTAYYKVDRSKSKSWTDTPSGWWGCDNGQIITWHGKKLMDITMYNVYRHNFGGRFIAISAQDVHGNLWHGRASYEWECINLYKNKVQPNEND